MHLHKLTNTTLLNLTHCRVLKAAAPVIFGISWSIDEQQRLGSRYFQAAKICEYKLKKKYKNCRISTSR